jgi:hypothetical protein
MNQAEQVSPTPKSAGEKLEGIAFQFCKIATVALIAGRYTLPVAAGLCAILYAMAYFSGKKDTRCWLRYPLLLTAVWGVVCGVSATAIARPDLLQRILPLR